MWSQWSEEPCSVSCGGGSQNRYRMCDNPGPAVGGKNCTGRNFDVRDCNEQPCPGNS
ncbi:MAG: thrombospondin type-1 domain-containing protein [Candidatus Thiodiazotropha taylori]